MGDAPGAAPRVGVLAIQGDVDAHIQALVRAGARGVRVLHAADIERVHGLVIPGGESTTIAKGLARLGLYEVLRERIRGGLAVLGTCAGAILLASRVDDIRVPVLGAVDVTAVRNAYGTQVDSFAAPVGEAAPALAGMRCVFIRAPRLHSPGPGVEVLARVNGDPVLVRENTVMLSTFHPELTEDARVHGLLVGMARVAKGK